MTEHLGITLGTLGLSLILYGETEKRIMPVYFGIFILTLGLNARAGALFVLPMLVLWDKDDKGYVILEPKYNIDDVSRTNLCGEKKQVKWVNIYYVK